MASITRLAGRSVNAAADAFGRLMDGGWIDLYGGAQPRSGDEPIRGGRSAVSLQFSTPAFHPAAEGVIVADTIAANVAVASIAKVTWARIYQKDHTTPVMDVSVGTEDAVLILPTANIPAGVTVTCSYFSHTIPKDKES